MNKALITLEIEYCVRCPFHKVLPDPDPHDWFNRDDEKIVCIKDDFIEIEGMLRPHETPKVRVPDFCRFLIKECNDTKDI